MDRIENNLGQALHNAVQRASDIKLDVASTAIEIPKGKNHGSYSTNVTIQLTRVLKSNPRRITGAIIEAPDKATANVESCEVVGPSFINFTTKNTPLAQIIIRIPQEQNNCGSSNDGRGLKANTRYVSANPTGDLHLDHARGAAWGDSITRLTKANGYDVYREYYVNDAGDQVVDLSRSLQARHRGRLGLGFDLPGNDYHGEDVKSIAIVITEECKDAYVKYSGVNLKFSKEKGIVLEFDKIRRDLGSFRVHFDIWSSRRSTRDEGKVEEALGVLHEKGLTYERGGALWFATIRFGGDRSRVLKKKDGSYTYLVPGIAYHRGKSDRSYGLLMDLLGTDHHGYIPRLKASIKALGNDPDRLQMNTV